MASERYNNSINEMKEYFGISEPCAKYIFHRALRARSVGDKYLHYNVQLQNALVQADKCFGIVWEKVLFGKEETELKRHGIDICDMPYVVFTWNDGGHSVPDETWQIISQKKKRKMIPRLIKRAGIYTK